MLEWLEWNEDYYGVLLISGSMTIFSLDLRVAVPFLEKSRFLEDSLSPSLVFDYILKRLCKLLALRLFDKGVMLLLLSILLINFLLESWFWSS